MNLIISEKNDKHTNRVESILQENTALYSRLNLDIESLKSTQVKFEDNAVKIEGPNCSFSTDVVEAVRNRSSRIDHLKEDKYPCDEDDFSCKEICNNTLEKLKPLFESTKRLNFFHDFYSETQFGQYTIPKNIGLKWPSSICTNDINYLKSFFESKKERVMELMDQDFRIDSKGVCFVKCVDIFGTAGSDKMQEDRWQVAGLTYQVRCTVVGKEYFVGKIKSNMNYEGQNVKEGRQNYTVFQPPKSVRMKAIQIMTELNLTQGVFDFIVTDNDEWFFDALNPVGRYQCIEEI